MCAFIFVQFDSELKALDRNFNSVITTHEEFTYLNCLDFRKQ